MKRIVISGASGTGKTTLTKWVADFYKIPMVDNSAKQLWKKYDITSHAQLIRETGSDPELGLNFQKDLLDLRKQNLAANEGGWVCDRGGIDLITYVFMQSHLWTFEQVQEYINEALSLITVQTHQIILQFTPETKLEDDGSRVSNAFYQMTTDAVMERVVRSYLPLTKVKTLIIPVWDLEARKNMIMKFLTHLTLNDTES